MPTYEFVCSQCKKTFDIVKTVAQYDPKKVICPKCQSKRVERNWTTVFVETSRKS